jgi:hypothetical protein
MKMFFLLVNVIVFLMTAHASHAEKMRIAVMDFRNDGVPNSTAIIITDIIRTEMINSGEFVLVERKQLDIILREQGLQKKVCTDEACAVQIGKLILAQKILIGTVVKLGKTTMINGRIVDVESGIAEFGEQQESAQDEELFATAALFTKRLIARIQGKSLKKGDIIRAKKTRGSIDYDSPFYHSPAAAGFVSLFPFYSGSWNKGFDFGGLGFVVGKFASLALCLYLGSAKPPQQGPPKESQYQHQGSSGLETDWFAYWDARDEYNSAKSRYRASIAMSIVMGVVFVGITIGDIIYSGISVDRYNRRNAVYSNREDVKTGDVRLSVIPHLNQFENHTIQPDGLDVAVSYSF